MKRIHITTYFSIPMVFTIIGLMLSYNMRPLTIVELSFQFIGSYLFYIFPHILWSVLTIYLNPKHNFAHAGYMLLTVSLIFIGLMSKFGNQDPSGLPYAWLLYLPLSIFLLLVVIVVFPRSIIGTALEGQFRYPCGEYYFWARWQSRASIGTRHYQLWLCNQFMPGRRVLQYWYHYSCLFWKYLAHH